MLMSRRLAILCVGILVVGAVLIAAIRSQEIIVMSVRSGSMQPSICSGDIVAVKGLAGTMPALGEIVLHGGAEEEMLLKRVGGIPGDKMTFTQDNVKRNGKASPYVSLCGAAVTDEKFGLEMIVPQNSVFVVGDNAALSVDSRSYGAVPGEYLAGYVIAHLKLGGCECGDISFNEGAD